MCTTNPDCQLNNTSRKVSAAFLAASCSFFSSRSVFCPPHPRFSQPVLTHVTASQLVPPVSTVNCYTRFKQPILTPVSASQFVPPFQPANSYTRFDQPILAPISSSQFLHPFQPADSCVSLFGSTILNRFGFTNVVRTGSFPLRS